MSNKKVLSTSLNCRHQGILGQNIATTIFSSCWCLGGKEQKLTFAQAIKGGLFLDTPLKTQGETMKLGLLEDKNKGPITRVSLKPHCLEPLFSGSSSSFFLCKLASLRKAHSQHSLIFMLWQFKQQEETH